mgnify:CR=1 FL=1
MRGALIRRLPWPTLRPLLPLLPRRRPFSSTPASYDSSYHWRHNNLTAAEKGAVGVRVVDSAGTPRVRCGGPLRAAVTLPSRVRLRELGVDAVELCLRWETETEFYVKETYTDSKNRHRTRYVPYRGHSLVEPAKAVVYDVLQEEDDEEDDDDNDDGTTLDVTLGVPQGLGASFALLRDHSSSYSSYARSAHALVLKATLTPERMSTLSRFLCLDWGYVFGVGANKDTERYPPPAVVTVADTLPLRVLPSLARRAALLEEACPRTRRAAKTFVSMGTVKNWFGNLFSGGISEEDDHADELPKSSSAPSGESHIELHLFEDVLIAQGDVDGATSRRAGRLAGRLQWSNGSNTEFPVREVGLSIIRTTRIRASRDDFKGLVFSASGLTGSTGNIDTTETTLLYTPLETKRLGADGFEAFFEDVPPLTPSFETDLLAVRYTVRGIVHYGGGVLMSPNPSIVEVPVCVVSQTADENLATTAPEVQGTLVGQEAPLEAPLEAALEVERRQVQEVQDKEAPSSRWRNATKGEVEAMALDAKGTNEEMERKNVKEKATTKATTITSSKKTEEVAGEEAPVPPIPEQHQHRKLLYSEAVAFVAHRLLSFDAEAAPAEVRRTVVSLRVRLRALRLASTAGGSWITFQRNKARRNRAARHKKHRRGGGKPAGHKAARRGERNTSSSNYAEGVTLEELEQIVDSLDEKVIDAWKGLGDVRPKQARAEYVALAEELAQRTRE